MALDNLAEIVSRWAAETPSVSGLTLFGSRAREGADPQSDWDFQVISSRPDMFAQRAWAQALVGATLRVYAPRMTRFGGVPKVNVIFDGAEADFVIIPERALRTAKLLVALGLHRREGLLRRRLADLAIAIRPGWRFLKGARRWEALYRRVVAEVADARLDDAEARRLGDVFVCDYLWSLRKIERGELVAAQRMLHRELVETNLRLLHEVKLRRGERSFPEGRRIEQNAPAGELSSLAPGGPCEAAALRDAAARAAGALRGLMAALVGSSWRWPEGVA